MQYLTLWLNFYINPQKLAHQLSGAPAPLWGFFAALQRSLMDSLFLYLPLYFMGRVPPERSYLSFISNDNYYGALVLLSPVVLLLEWILAAAAIHLVLRMLSRKSEIDQILNISGFIQLGIGTILLLWDWSWLTIGGLNQYMLGITHLVIDIWGIAISAICLKRILKVPIGLGIVLNVIGIAVAMPFAIMFMRSPL